MSTPLAWIEVRALVPNGWQELVAECLMIGPCTSAAFGRPNLAVDEAPPGKDFVRVFISNAEDSKELRTELRSRLQGLAKSTGDPDLEGLDLEFKLLPPEDYATSWKKSWKPFRVAPLCLLPPWDQRDIKEGELRLTIQPGGSFGSGRHATTRTCVRVLTRRIRGGERLLDAGAGSGILSVAASLLGAQSAVGFDIDPNSAVASSELASDNGVSDKCTFRTGGFETLESKDTNFDVVLANIYSDIIQAHAKDLHARLSPSGWFAFSGCPHHHLDPTVRAIKEAGLEIEESLQRGRWHTFVGRKK
ncbi:MAG: ribosomal protein L11 methyltransferase [Planctomycetota bacterium]